ncbi:MAG: formylglycine-generating enzyme family protein, partial [Candidatus Riflebacteria bacterium]|nr:formylglycine-generating enzyme family protein [Candidatus Riflebacteria bacterium]
PYPQEDAVDPLVTEDSITGTIERCHRGGGYNTQAERCRSASRQGSGLNDHKNHIGFRVVLVSTGE